MWDDLGRRSPGRSGDLAAVESLLGAPRARLLSALRSPATTSALAGRFGVTPSAVSQHLAVLYRGGLVDRQRSGRTVLYQASELGLALLGAGLVRAVVYSGYGATPELIEVADPACPADGVVIAVGATGVCRSDWHAWKGHDPVALPHIGGHEFAGVVGRHGA